MPGVLLARGCQAAACAQLLKVINALYRIEDGARGAGLTAKQRTLLRQRRAALMLWRINNPIREERPQSSVTKACL